MNNHQKSAHMTYTGLASQVEVMEEPPYRFKKSSPLGSMGSINCNRLFGHPDDPNVQLYSKVITNFCIASWAIFLNEQYGCDLNMLYVLDCSDIQAQEMDDNSSVHSQKDKSSRAKQMNKVLQQSGLSSVEIASLHIENICYWIYIHGFTTSSMINLLINRKGGSYANTLVKKGFLRKTKTTAGAYKAGFPESVYTLTELGLKTAEEYSGEYFPYEEVKTHRIPNGSRGSDLRHSVVIQRSILQLKKAIKSIEDDVKIIYTSERMWIANSGLKKQKGVKLFDGIMKFLMNDVPWGCLFLEIELSIKGINTEAFFKFCEMIVSAISNNSKYPARVLILTDKEGIFKQYRKVLVDGDSISAWENGNQTRKSFVIPKDIRELIDIRLMDATYPEVELFSYLNERFSSNSFI